MYVTQSTPNRPDQCSLWAISMIDDEVMYLGYYNGKIEIVDNLNWDIYRNTQRLFFLVQQKYYKNSTPGSKKFLREFA